MKACENCHQTITEAFGSGRFCCIKCSRSFSTKASREEINRKVSNALAGKPSLSKGKSSSLKGRKRPIEVVEEAVRRRSEKRLQRNASLPFEALSLKARRERILEEQAGVCAICSIKPTWNSLPLVFHLDHIKGRQFGHQRENLRMICPNCHSQTETYTSKNASSEGRERMAKRKSPARGVGIEPTNTTSKAVVLPLN